MDLPHSDGCFVKAYPAETAEAFCDGLFPTRHNMAAFAIAMWTSRLALTRRASGANHILLGNGTDMFLLGDGTSHFLLGN
jgi:hypothetical protein